MTLGLTGKKVLVLGLGDTGMSMTRWLARQGALLTAADTRAAPPFAAQLARELPQVRVHCGEFRREDFDATDLIAVSPGIDPRVGELAAAIKRGTPVAGDVELFTQALQKRERAARVIAITGSNGKSTVTAMCGAMCAEAGQDTVMAGNIGLPVLDVLTQIEDGRAMPDTVVLELSSFQLETTASLVPSAATMLNLSEDHMDRYDSFSDYGAAKARIFAGGGVQVLNRDDVHSMAMARADRELSTFGLVGANDRERMGHQLQRHSANAGAWRRHCDAGGGVAAGRPTQRGERAGGRRLVPCFGGVTQHHGQCLARFQGLAASCRKNQ